MKYLVAVSAALLANSAAAEPLLYDHGRLFIPVEVNGVATEGLLDSGAEATLIDPKLARAAGLGEGSPMTIRGTGGTAQVRMVEGARIKALGLTVRPEAVVVMDLADLSQRVIKRPTAAVVGRELFDAGRLAIDIAGRNAAVVARTVEPRGRKLPLTTHAGIESVPVSVNGAPAQAEFDLGNGSGVLVSRAFANRLKLKVTGQKAGGAIGGERMRDTVVLDQLDLAGSSFRNVPAAIDDQPNANDLNIGTEILENFVITTDFAQRAIWLQPVGGERS